MPDLTRQNRISLVTGGGGGLGRVVSRALSDDGWTVYVAGRRIEALTDTARHTGTGAIIPIAADVTDERSVQNLFAEIVARDGRLDLLFNNAGVNVPKVPLDEVSFVDLRNIVEVNLFGALVCAREAMRVMKRQVPAGGRIINNGSVSAYAPRPNTAPYTATKHAITGLTKSIILDGRSFGVTCGQIDIGNAAVERTAYIQAGTAQADGTVAAEPQIPAIEVGRAVVYMASLPLEANIPFLTVMASGMPLYGRG